MASQDLPPHLDSLNSRTLRAYLDSVNNAVVDINVAGTANEISVSNGSFVDGNPAVIGLADDAVMPGNVGIRLPSGTTAQEPISTTNGTIRYNSDLNTIRAVIGGAWTSLNFGGLNELVDDPGPRLGGDLQVDGYEIQTVNNNELILHSDRGVEAVLGDAAGAFKLGVKDSGGTEVASINSDGVGDFASLLFNAGSAFKAETHSIGDDSTQVFSSVRTGETNGNCIIAIVTNFNNTAGGVAICSDTDAMVDIGSGSAVTYTTGALGGTTGTDGDLTISPTDTQELTVENRLGSTQTVTIFSFAP